MDKPVAEGQGMQVLSLIRGGQSSATTTAIVFVHGWGCRSSDSKLAFDTFTQTSANFSYFAVDLPGHGSSPKSICPEPTVTCFATALLRTIEQLDVRDVYLAGHSMGCRIIPQAWKQAHSKKFDIKGLIFLEGSSFRIHPSGGAFEKDLTKQELVIRRIKAFQQMFSENTPEDFEPKFLEYLSTLDKTYIDALRDDYLRYDHDQLEDDLAALGKSGIPMLNLQATNVNERHDRIQLKSGESSRFMDLIQEMVPQAEQYVVIGSGHFPHIDQPRRTTQLIADFIQKHSA
ncbi:hypothetical protein LTR62_003264 [Meristemomyces frigidus]|uniref:AB hydrolase-1 domain-containing protein n=1 Tax=Meristemomyces frigidus TaxID=1508187 RepID=A0AAN7TKX3_9PEZI|nr:hypothetical protein LTR62_003264 [Meristemomyces frigidus]